jgi:hypothetical protein
MIAAGLALIPLWWREAFAVEDLGVAREAEGAVEPEVK